MDCLVEVHTKEELEKVLKTSTNIIGINNRNLKTFKIDINTTLKLKKLIPKTKLIVSESGFKTKADIKKLKNINAVLIGTTFMKAKNINKKIGELLK
jgi:indole-3-glycerol phosphate synthase